MFSQLYLKESSTFYLNLLQNKLINYLILFNVLFKQKKIQFLLSFFFSKWIFYYNFLDVLFNNNNIINNNAQISHDPIFYLCLNIMINTVKNNVFLNHPLLLINIIILINFDWLISMNNQDQLLKCEYFHVTQIK